MIAVFLIALGFVTATPGKLPFTVDAIEDVSANFPGAPRVESSAFGQWKGKWLFIGGRIAGYHAMGGAAAEFPRADANREVWVVDSTTKLARTYHVPVDLLPLKLAPLKDEWISTGQLYYQDGPSLYIAGGYGQDSTGHWVTYPLISKIDLPSLIDGVMRGNLPAESITFSSSPLVQSAGGDLVKLADNNFYLVMGHVFMGSYTAFEGQGEQNADLASQTYLNEIRKLKIKCDSHGKLNVTLIEKYRDENEFHRRDLNVTKLLSPRGLGLVAYGGVFTPDTQLSYSKPIYLFADSAPTVDTAFNQQMNTYKCAKLLFYDASVETMYTAFFGGISRFAWDAVKQQFVENSRVGTKASGNYLDGLQWSNQVSTIRTVMKDGKPRSLEMIQPNSLPAFVGTDAFFIPLEGLARTNEDTDILNLASLRGTKTLVGYLYGGIRAYPFRFPYTKTSLPYDAGTVPTEPSGLILKVYVTVDKD